jgi:hypothetical protein
MPTTGLVLMVASTTDALFGGPTAGSFVTGDDVVLFRGDLSGLGQPGYLQTTRFFPLTGELTSSDPVQLYWFPTLTIADYDSSNLAAGTTYGSYRDAVGINGSAPWIVPGDGNTVALKFFTISEGGSNLDTAGWANFTVVPEASNLITAGLTLGLCALRLFRGARQKLI